MSGIELAGLVLGAIPILIIAIDASREGTRRAKLGLRRRTYIDKLSHGLLLQKSILEETVRSIVRASGCEDPWRLDDDPFQYLSDEGVVETIADFVGEINYASISATLDQCCKIIAGVAGNIKGLLPTIKDPVNDLRAIIKANKDLKHMQLDLLSRLKLVLKAKDMENAAQELDTTTNALDRLVRGIISNRGETDGAISVQTRKLAKYLRRVRGFSNHLYRTLVESWKCGCHRQHEAKLLLEDRINSAAARPVKTHNASSSLSFRLLLAADIYQERMLRHEAIFQVIEDDIDEDPASIPSTTRRVSVKVAVPKTAVAKVTTIDHICGAIEMAKASGQKIIFALNQNGQNFGTIQGGNDTFITWPQSCSITLRDHLLCTKQPPYQNLTFSLKYRMLLALTVASNLLQLQQTQWLEESWSKADIHFMLRSANKESNGKDIVDLTRPFINIRFSSKNRDAQCGSPVQPKVALLDLGILLLEIWHEQTLEAYFSLDEPPTDYYSRQYLALQWRDETNNPLLKLYYTAVSYCISGMMGGHCRFDDWEDYEFWAAVCQYIIKPLSKNCEQWR